MAKMKETPTSDPLFGEGTCAPTAARSTTCTSSRSRRRTPRPGRGTTTSWSRPSPPTRPSARSPTAAARWSSSDQAIPGSAGPPAGPRASPSKDPAMFELLGIPPQALFGQLLLGLINGSFYAMLSLGLAVIFGLLNIINFAHGAQYMMGAFAAWMLGNYLGLGYWWALLLAPIIVGGIGIVIERTMLARLYHLDHLYGLLADLRARADHPGPVPQRLRRLRPALHGARAAGGRAEPRLHVPAQLPRLGGGGLAHRLLRHLVPDREDPARLLPARRDREPDAGRRLRHQRAAADHADLRLRRRPRGLRRRAGGADLLGQPRTWAPT